MRIALFSHFYSPTVSGVVTSMENLRRGLIELGHQVYVFSPKSKDYSYPKSLRIIEFPSLNIRAKGVTLPLPITFSPKIYQKIKALKLDLIHAQHPFYVGKSAYFYAKRFKIPLIFTFHTRYDKATLANLPFLPRKSTTRIVNHYLREFVSHCDGIIFPTQEIRSLYFKKLPIRSTIIPSGIDLAQFKGKSRLSRKKLKINSQKIILLTTGRISKEKNLEFLIRAFEIISKNNDQAIFLIVGGGPQQENLEKLVKQKKLSQKIIFIGEVPYQNINDYYKLADIYLYSSLADTQGLVLPEAMASQLPIVAVSNQQIKEVINHNQDGILTVNRPKIFAGEVLKLINNQKKRIKLAQNALKSAQKFTYQKTAKAVADFYQQVLNSYS